MLPCSRPYGGPGPSYKVCDSSGDDRISQFDASPDLTPWELSQPDRNYTLRMAFLGVLDPAPGHSF